MWFVVRFVDWKSGIALKELKLLKAISVGVHLEGVIKGLYLGNFPALPETSQKHPSCGCDVFGCGFVKGLFVGNIPAPSETCQQRRRSSNDVCGSYMEYTPKT